MLISNQETFQKYIAVNNGFSFENVSIFIAQMEEKHLKPLLGKDLYEALKADYQNASAEAKHLKLLEKAQAPLANFAMLQYLPIGNMQISDAGFRNLVGTDGEYRPIAKWQYEDLKATIRKTAYAGLEGLLDFLEENHADYPLWDYTDQRAYFLNSAKAFNEYCHINDSRLIYLKMLPEMRRQEGIIAKQISPEQFKVLKDIHQDAGTSFTAIQAEAVEKLCTAIAKHSFAESIGVLPVQIEGGTLGIFHNQFMADFSPLSMPDADLKSGWKRKLQEDGDEALADAIALMEENLPSFPEYEANAYTPPDEAHRPDDSRGFIMM